MSEWPLVLLGNHTYSCLGKMLDQKKNKGKNEPYLANVNVRWGYFDLANVGEMRFEDHEFERYGLKNGDLVVCEGGEPGRCAIWCEEDNFPRMKIQKALHRIRPKKDLNNYYLYYWFLNSGRCGDLEPFFTGTTIKHLTGKAIAQLELRLPPLKVQERLSDILKSLDDKIALNRKLNETLEGMARALFQSWFVDFDPVKAKLAAVRHGRDPERACMAALSGKLRIPPGKPRPDTLDRQLPTAEALDAAIAALDSLTTAQHQNLAQTAFHFPANFQDSELGLIPEGWEVLVFEELVTAKQGKYLAKNEMEVYPSEDNNVPVWGGNGVLGYTRESAYDEPISLITCRGSNCGLIQWTESASWVSNNSFGCKTKYGSEYFLRIYLLGEDFSACISGSAQPQITFTSLRGKTMLFPVRKLVCESYSVLIQPIADEVMKLNAQSRTLADLRDTLLPKLLSGELSVGGLDKFVKSAMDDEQ